MDTFLQQLFNLFVAPPGNVIYYVVLAFSIVAALQAVIINLRAGAIAYPYRILTGLGLLLGAEVLMFVASALVWQGLANPHIILPSLDRAVTAFGLACLVWLWCTPAPKRWADGLLALVALLLVILFFVTYNNWSVAASGVMFSGSSFDWAWELGMLVILLVGVVVLFLTRPAGWPIGLGILVINLAGHIAQFLWPAITNDFSGVVRLAQLCSYTLLPAIAQRLQPFHREVKHETVQSVAYKPIIGVTRERRHYSADPRTVNSWLQLAVEDNPEKIYAEFSRAFGQTMLADLCLVIRAGGETDTVDVLTGFDLVREEYLQGLSIPSERIPSIATALRKGRSLRLGGDAGPSTEIDALANYLALENPGNLMMVPLNVPPVVWGAVLMLSPYSSRPWSADDQTYLLTSIETMVQVLQKGEQAPVRAQQPVPAAPPEAQPDHPENAALQSRLNQLEQEKALLQADLHSFKTLNGSIPPELESLVALQKEAEETISALQAENERLQAALSEPGTAPVEQPTAGPDYTAEFDPSRQQIASLQTAFSEPGAAPAEQSAAGADFTAELDQARQQIASLQSALSEASAALAEQPATGLDYAAELEQARLQISSLQAALAAAEAQVNEPVEEALEPGDGINKNEDGEVINSLVQELRQPMASITGYTDLLLAESAGILGALQRKFLERIKGSVERLQAILNDLVQITAMQSGPLELVPVPINANNLIDEAVASISSQLREKNITLRVELPDELPELYTDRDALAQIVSHLLQNASSATPVEGTVGIRVQMVNGDDEAQELQLDVSDTGGGIDEQDLPRVFSRRYRADNPLVQGVGDTGVGLSITRMLVEAQHGRIWVESHAGQGSTFRVVLPSGTREEPATP